MPKRWSLYERLSVHPQADEISIRRAYKRLSDPLLPAKNPSAQDAPAQLQALREAWEILSDLDQRADYDEFGDALLKKGFSAREERRRVALEKEREERRARAALIAPTAQRRETQADGTPVKRDWSLRLAIGKGLAKRGGPLRLPVTRPVRCERCEGTGRRDKTCKSCDGEKELIYTRAEACAPCLGVGLVAGERVRCKKCKGRGRRGAKACGICGGCGLAIRRLDCPACVGRGLRSIRETKPCRDCSGTGLVACPRCAGNGNVPKALRFKLYVPSHVDEAAEYRYAGAGFSSRDGAPTDLYVQFAVVARAPRR